MKYFGAESKQDLIDEMYEGEVSIYYKKAEYDIWLDGRGYCIAVTNFDRKLASSEMLENSLKAYATVEELIDNYILYDGMKLSDAIEMDVKDIYKRD